MKLSYVLAVSSCVVCLFSGYFLTAEIAHPGYRPVAVIGCFGFGLLFVTGAIGVARTELRERITKSELQHRDMMGVRLDRTFSGRWLLDLFPLAQYRTASEPEVTRDQSIPSDHTRHTTIKL